MIALRYNYSEPGASLFLAGCLATLGLLGLWKSLASYRSHDTDTAHVVLSWLVAWVAGSLAPFLVMYGLKHSGEQLEAHGYALGDTSRMMKSLSLVPAAVFVVSLIPVLTFITVRGATASLAAFRSRLIFAGTPVVLYLIAAVLGLALL